MSQTIIALCTAEQLAPAIPDWQRYGIQFATTSEHLNHFQSVDCILCLPDTPASLLGAVWQRFPESRFFIIQDKQQWLDGQTRQSVDFNQALSAFKQLEKKTGDSRTAQTDTNKAVQQSVKRNVGQRTIV